MRDSPQVKSVAQTFALLKILALENKHIEEGKTAPLTEVVARLRSRLERRSNRVPRKG